MSRLYEGFRDSLIDIQNTHFPFEITTPSGGAPEPVSSAAGVQSRLSETDDRFAHYFAQDPLKVVLIGRQSDLAAFRSLSVHLPDIIGSLEGDFMAVSIADLGKLVWPIVKNALAGSNNQSLRELDRAARKNKIIVGIDAVSQEVNSAITLSLFVEEDFHVQGHFEVAEDGNIILPESDVNELFDDDVDALIEKVLAKGGDVVFLGSNTMSAYQKIALIRRN